MKARFLVAAVIIMMNVCSCQSFYERYKQNPFTPSSLSAGYILDDHGNISGGNIILNWNLKPDIVMKPKLKK